MPRYFFHLEKAGNRVRIDSDGAALPDDEAAWYHAYRSFLALEEPQLPAEAATLEVEDETGTPVLMLSTADFSFAPA